MGHALNDKPPQPGSRVVIHHRECGVFLGCMMGLGFWSRLDSAGLPAAVTFESEMEAAAFVSSWAEGAPKDVDFHRVMPDAGDYATIQAIVDAGLEGWIDEKTPVANERMC